MSALTAHYKCACLAAEVGVAVPPRRSDEDLGTWMQVCLGPALYLDHRTRSPSCGESHMQYVKLPHNDGDPVGSKRMVM